MLVAYRLCVLEEGSVNATGSRPLDSLVKLMNANDLDAAAMEALTTYVTLDRDDVRSRAWCLALYGVVESRFGHWDTALDALDEAAVLARKAKDARLEARIAIDRLIPIAHHIRSELPGQIEHAVSIVEEQSELAATLSAILTRLPGSETGATARIVARPVLQLLTENVPHQKVLPLQGDGLTLGRKRSCDLQIQCDAEVSRVHCHLEVRSDGWHVVDVSSRGNTVVRGGATSTGPLRDGVVVQMGSTRLRVGLV